MGLPASLFTVCPVTGVWGCVYVRERQTDRQGVKAAVESVLDEDNYNRRQMSLDDGGQVVINVIVNGVQKKKKLINY